VSLIEIRDIQGDGFYSPYAKQHVVTIGVVTSVLRRGFFIQTPSKEWDGKGSDAIFVYSSDSTVSVGCEVEVSGRCVDYLKHDTAKPVTQIQLREVRVITIKGKSISPIALTPELLPSNNTELAQTLNALEGMLVRIDEGQTFIAPSNPFADYVVAGSKEVSTSTDTTLRSADGGVLVDQENPLRWFPGFRVTNYNHAQRLNVGARLTSSVCGPLNYRVDAYQVAVNASFDVEHNDISPQKAKLNPSDGAITIMTLNCFNLDAHVESESLVLNPRQDVDDDWGEGRFHTLAQAVVLQANTPDIVALQEIQDNDGAEISDVVDASNTYELLIKTIQQFSGVTYAWADVPPVLGEDGGQPGGNIRNAYLYNPERVELVADSVSVFATKEQAYKGSRKPLLAEFIERSSGKRLAVINVHLASKRHQASIFSLENAGVDAKESVRVEQARLIREQAERLLSRGTEFYITGDFNDLELSQSLQECVGQKSYNLVMSLPEAERYDYNHRGKLQVLMHGIVPKKMYEQGRAQYEIIHGNELIGVQPGQKSDKPSDHAYVMAKLVLA